MLASTIDFKQQHAHRLMSLWEIMKIFRAHSLYLMLRQMEIFEGRFEKASEADGLRILTDEEMSDVSSTLNFAISELKLAQFEDLADKA